MLNKYLLGGEDGKTPVLCEDLMAWAQAFEARHEEASKGDDPWRVKRTYLNPEETICISTVFLGIDHAFSEDAPPLLFETMVFWPGSDMDNQMRRCSTWAGAIVQHAVMVHEVEARMQEAANQT